MKPNRLYIKRERLRGILHDMLERPEDGVDAAFDALDDEALLDYARALIAMVEQRQRDLDADFKRMEAWA